MLFSQTSLLMLSVLGLLWFLCAEKQHNSQHRDKDKTCFEKRSGGKRWIGDRARFWRL